MVQQRGDRALRVSLRCTCRPARRGFQSYRRTCSQKAASPGFRLHCRTRTRIARVLSSMDARRCARSWVAPASTMPSRSAKTRRSSCRRRPTLDREPSARGRLVYSAFGLVPVSTSSHLNMSTALRSRKSSSSSWNCLPRAGSAKMRLFSL
jgi:hypothetical protein